LDDLITEKLADKLPKLVAKDASEFLAWTFAVKSHFNRIPGFKDEVLTTPRSELTFGSISS